MIYTVKIEEHYAWTVQVEAASQEESGFWLSFFYLRPSPFYLLHIIP